MNCVVTSSIQPNSDATGPAEHTKARQLMAEPLPWVAPGRGLSLLPVRPLSEGCPGPLQERSSCRAGGFRRQPALAHQGHPGSDHWGGTVLSRRFSWRSRRLSITLHCTPLTHSQNFWVQILQMANFCCTKMGLQWAVKDLQKSKLNQEEVLQ